MNTLTVLVAGCVQGAKRPLNSVNVVIVGPTYRLVVRYAGMVRQDADTRRLPGGSVGITVSSNPYDVLDIGPVGDRDIVAAAWEHGAWDIVRTVIGPGYDGPLPPVIGPDEQPQTALDGHAIGTDWPEGLASLAAEARRLGYTTWAWRPMLLAPETRVKAFAHRDATLDPLTLTRPGTPPHVRIRPAKPGTQLEITLGRKP